MAGMTVVYFDFLCPYAWRGLELAKLLQDAGRETFTLRHFSLVQGNHAGNPDRRAPTWWLHEQPQGEGSEYQRASLPAFLAAQAAARQGEAARLAYTLALFRARHERGEDLADPQTRRAAAETAGLDLARFDIDLQDESALRAALGEELGEAADLAVFGTPTFVLDGGQAAYYRFSARPESVEQAAGWWALYGQVLQSGAQIETIKRPR